MSKNELKFGDDSIKVPTRIQSLYEAWERANVKILSWIIRTHSPQIANSVIHFDSSKDL